MHALDLVGEQATYAALYNTRRRFRFDPRIEALLPKAIRMASSGMERKEKRREQRRGEGKSQAAERKAEECVGLRLAANKQVGSVAVSTPDYHVRWECNWYQVPSPSIPNSVFPLLTTPVHLTSIPPAQHDPSSVACEQPSTVFKSQEHLRDYSESWVLVGVA